MELTFIRADHEVTGSCHYLHVGETHLLVDYGMEQGKNYYENIPLPVKPSEIDLVLITHAHIDHTGMLPELYAKGFRGRIICTKATKELSDIMLRDCAHIQMQEAEYATQKAGRRGSGEKVEPVYTMEDTMNVLRLFEAHPYGVTITLCPGVAARFTDIGHLLGSSSIELWLTEGEETRKIVFSGDIGNTNQPLLRDPLPTKSADYVVMESTYGNRYHDRAEGENAADAAALKEKIPLGLNRRPVLQLAAVIRETLDRGGNVVIPAFAVGRTQVMLYFIRLIKDNNLIPNHPDFPVYVDSPMAVSATSIFENNEIDCYDEEARALLSKGINPLSFPNLHLSITTQESQAINEDREPKVILSASGMCDAGRIRHHIKHNVSNPNSSILFVGYQSEGTLGRRLLDGAQKIRLFGKDYDVHAHIVRMDGMSGHADKQGLLDWINAFEEKPRQVFLVHGDDEAANAFEDCLVNEYGYNAMAPYSGTRYDLLSGRFIRIAKPVPVKEKKTSSASVRSGADSYTKLNIAAKRLNGVIEDAKGLPNKELDAFTRELNDLCNKYRIAK